MVELPLRAGQKYWSCADSVESCNYDEYCRGDPCRPWQGILQLCRRSAGVVNHLHRFNAETEAVSDNSNSYAQVWPDDLFATREEAMAHYRSLCIDRADRAAAEVHHWLAEVKSTLK